MRIQVRGASLLVWVCGLWLALLALPAHADEVAAPTAQEAASDDHEHIRDLVKLKVDIEAIDFALAHRPTGSRE